MAEFKVGDRIRRIGSDDGATGVVVDTPSDSVSSYDIVWAIWSDGGDEPLWGNPSFYEHVNEKENEVTATLTDKINGLLNDGFTVDQIREQLAEAGKLRAEYERGFEAGKNSVEVEERQRYLVSYDSYEREVTVLGFQYGAGHTRGGWGGSHNWNLLVLEHSKEGVPVEQPRTYNPNKITYIEPID